MIHHPVVELDKEHVQAGDDDVLVVTAVADDGLVLGVALEVVPVVGPVGVWLAEEQLIGILGVVVEVLGLLAVEAVEVEIDGPVVGDARQPIAGA